MQDLRKVQETNKRTLIISLPKRWGPRFPVAAGDHLQLDLQSDGSVLMRRHGHAQARPQGEVDATGRSRGDLLALLVQPFLAGLGSLSITGLQGWPASEVGLLRDGMRDRFGAEVTEESSDRLQLMFMGADRPEQVRFVARRLVQLACDALRGEVVEHATVLRHQLLAARLVFLASRSSGDRAFDAAAGRATLRVVELAALLATSAGEPVAEESIQAFGKAAIQRLDGYASLTPGPVPAPPAAGLNFLLLTATNSLAGPV